MTKIVAVLISDVFRDPVDLLVSIDDLLGSFLYPVICQVILKGCTVLLAEDLPQI